jgi:hypothetical protein
MIVILCNQAVQGQGRKGFEEYYYPAGGAGFSSLSTRLFNQSGRGWYTECRYNYEEEGTAAVSLGKTFSKEGKLSWSFTPEVGFAVGKLQGISLGINGSLSVKRLSLTSSTLYTSGFEKGRPLDCFFNWTELNGQITKQLYTGITLQFSSSPCEGIKRETGVQLGFLIKRWTFPFYVFERADAHAYFVAAACYEWKGRSK